jgi:hypothetical protein
LFDAAIPPMWSAVAPLRRFVGELLSATSEDPEHVAKVAMTVHELLENAVKYGEGEVRVTVMVDGRGYASRIEVGARTSARGRVEASRRIDALRDSANRKAHYQALMREAAAKGKSGLGLARVATEGGMDLSIREVSDALVVVATPMHHGEQP